MKRNPKAEASKETSHVHLSAPDLEPYMSSNLKLYSVRASISEHSSDVWATQMLLFGASLVYSFRFSSSFLNVLHGALYYR